MQYLIVAAIIVGGFYGLTFVSRFAERKLSMKTRHTVATVSIFTSMVGVFPLAILALLTSILPPGGIRSTLFVLAGISLAAVVLGGLGHMAFYLPHYSRRIFRAKEHVDREIATRVSDTAIEKIIRVADPVDQDDMLETKDQLLGRITALRHVLRHCYRHGFISMTAVDILADETIEEVLNRTKTRDEPHEQRLDSYVEEMRKQQRDLRK